MNGGNTDLASRVYFGREPVGFGQHVDSVGRVVRLCLLQSDVHPLGVGRILCHLSQFPVN